MTTVEELHIGIKQGLQKVDSNKYDELLPQQLDWFINKTIVDYVREQCNSDNPKRYEDIEELFNEKQMVVFKDTIYNRVYSLLPQNYFEMVDDNSIIVKGCDDNIITPSTITKYITKVQFDNYDEDLYKNFKIVQTKVTGNVELFNLDNYDSLGEGINDLVEKFLLINLILETINESFPDIECYYEYYNGTYYHNQFIFISESVYTGIQFQYLGNTNTQLIDIPNITYNINSFSSTSQSIIPNRLTKQKDIYNLINHPFGKSSAKSPISSIINKKLFVYLNKGFNIQGTKITYVRKPRIVNYYLNRMTDLKPEIHQMIIDRTVVNIAGTLNTDTFQNLAKLMEINNK